MEPPVRFSAEKYGYKKEDTIIQFKIEIYYPINVKPKRYFKKNS